MHRHFIFISHNIEQTVHFFRQSIGTSGNTSKKWLQSGLQFSLQRSRCLIAPVPFLSMLQTNRILYEWAVNINVKTMSSGNYMKRPVAVLFPGNLIHTVNVLYNNRYFCFIAHTFLSAFQQITYMRTCWFLSQVVPVYFSRLCNMLCRFVTKFNRDQVAVINFQ